MKPCTFCSAPTEDHVNYCNWDCMVNSAKAADGPTICPNGLPIRSIRGYDSAMMEHEHADHPTYRFPVDADYCGPEHQWTTMTDEGPRELTQDEIEFEKACEHETHALIYADSSIALTMYECCYFVFALSDGKLLYDGISRTRGDWKLTDESLRRIREPA